MTRIDLVRNILREKGKPLHLREISEELGNPGYSVINTLAGILHKYSREGKFFEKVAPNTFQIKEKS